MFMSSRHRRRFSKSFSPMPSQGWRSLEEDSGMESIPTKWKLVLHLNLQGDFPLVCFTLFAFFPTWFITFFDFCNVYFQFQPSFSLCRRSFCKTNFQFFFSAYTLEVTFALHGFLSGDFMQKKRKTVSNDFKEYFVQNRY